MSVLRITAHLLSPVASSKPIHLDSILLQAHPDVHGVFLSKTDPLPTAPSLPIAPLEIHGATTYLCSAGRFPDVARVGMERLVKRKDPEDFAWRERNWNPGSGPEKAYCLPVPTTETPAVEWLAVGRRRGVKKLLAKVQSVGGMRRHGYGRIKRWEITVEDYVDPVRCLVTPEGTAARHLPVAWCREFSLHDHGSFRPPYWHPDTCGERVYCGSRCTLRESVLERVTSCR